MNRRYCVFIAILALLFSCKEEYVEDFSKGIRFLGTWTVNSVRTVESDNGVENYPDEFRVDFNSDQSGTLYRTITSDFIWITECYPDILVISNPISGSSSIFRNTIFNVLEYGTSKIELENSEIDTIMGVEIVEVTNRWVLTR